jgi:hypothetical protein
VLLGLWARWGIGFDCVNRFYIPEDDRSSVGASL